MATGSLNTSFWLAILLQTIGSVDMPGSGARKMPSPRQYVIFVAAWGVLNLVADAGMEKAANTAGWVILLAGSVLGPFGQRLVNLLNTIGSNFGISSPIINNSGKPSPGSTAPSTGGTGQPGSTTPTNRERIA